MKPKISVVIAAYNEAKLLPSFLQSLKRQTYPSELLEVIIVDNGSTDHTAQIAQEFGYKPYPYTKLQGCGAARAYGAKQAHGDILVFTDPDTILPSNWLQSIEKSLSDKTVKGGSGRPIFEQRTLLMKLLESFHDIFHRINHLFHKPVIWGFTMFFRKDAYDVVGGIDEKLLSADDWELALRIQKKFGKDSIRYFPSMAVTIVGRKEDNIHSFIRYALDGVHNYVTVMLLGRKEVNPVFNVR